MSYHIIPYLHIITGCAVASPVLTATTWLCQWEMAIFDPLQSRHP